ncbi:GumC family protein [uncultured Devosia sp.]|uniref:GumC family protein n=1 Tax=uncultured Devosia sp. TaxID=211434 RepID=UPI0035CB591A
MDEPDIDLRAIFGLLYRQLHLILITLAVVIGVAVLVSFVLKPVYTASALVMVDPSRKDLLDPASQYGSASSDNARVDSEVELVRSDNVLLKVIQAQNLLTDPAFGVSLGTRDRIMAFLHLGDGALPTGEEALNSVLNTLRSAISVERRGLTYLILVQARSGDRAKAAQIANSVAEEYIKEQVLAKVNSTLTSRDVLQERITQARNSIVASEGAFDTFIDSNIERIEQQAGNASIGSLRAQIDELTAARSRTAATADLVADNVAKQDWQTTADLLASDALRELERQREQLTASLVTASAGSPAAIDLRAQLSQLDRQLQDTASAGLGDLREAVNATQTQESSLRQQIRETVIRSDLPAEVLTNIYELQQGAELARRQYETLLARVQELDAQASLQVADSRIVSPALAPETPSFPNITLILLAAGLVGLILGVGLAFLYENYIGGFTSEQQTEAVLRQKVAASLPRQKTLKAGSTSHADTLVNAPLSIFSESIRRVRASINHVGRANALIRAEEDECSIVVVTSTLPGEGKTTTALSLARSYALTGKRTLLVDADLRKPTVHKALGMEPSRGLLDYLLDQSNSFEIRSVLSKDPLTNLTVLVGGRRSDVPTDQLISDGSFQRLLNASRKTFDVVVIDSPPLAPVVDGLYLAQYATAVIFVVRWANTPQVESRKALTALRESTKQVVPITVVLNQQELSRNDYQVRYGEYYVEAHGSARTA